MNLISSINNLNTQIKYPGFNGKEQAKKNFSDLYLDSNNKQAQKLLSPSITNKIFGLPTFSTLSMLGLGGYIIKVEKNLIKKKKNPAIQSKEKQAILNTFLKKSGIALALVCLGNYIATSVAEKNYDKHFKKQEEYFNSINKTSATLSDKTLYSSYIGGVYNSNSGNITLNHHSIIDPYRRFKNKYVLKHELVHAKQFELIARSQDGIKKLNYSTFKNIANSYAKHKYTRNLIDNIYQNINSDTTHKYDNLKLATMDMDINYKDLIAGMHTLIHNPDTTPDDVPMIINEEHYKKVIENNPPLTPEEEVQAEKYYQAHINYVPGGFLSGMNPFSAYRQNLLEKEAFKENPWYTRII